jgi:WD40 repeat protein
MESPTVELAKGTLVWYHDDAVVWKSATIFSASETQYVLEIGPGQDNVTLPRNHPICLRNKDLFNAEGMVMVDDLTQLQHLNEPAVLHSLQMRFDVDKIYTFTGPILISMNPFKRLPGMYDDETLAEFVRTKSTTKPHVFAIANAAFQGICEDGKCQTVLISGESGAGKTVSTKFVMKYLASAGSGGDGERTEVEKQVLESNPLLEAFGNAKTLRNDNSSRFGKFIELQFRPPPGAPADAPASRLCGARIHTYLLEKVRVADQQELERNYHIFYQCCAAAAAYGSPDGVYEFPQVNKAYKGPGLKLDVRGFADHSQFNYLTKSSCTAIESMDDLAEFEITIAAMKTVGLPMDEINAVLNCVSGCLLLGNCKLVPDNEGSRIDNDNDKMKAFITACDILGVDSTALEKALTTKTIVTRGETFVSPVGAGPAGDFRDALARQIYGLLFLCLVDRANTSIGYLAEVELFCGVLDIFGFECFKVNSFEQLCINFTNERLQQFFNNFVFKLEEILYKNEDIPWDPLDFPDNSESVDLISDPKTGLFAMLDEECVVPQGSDKGYCNKLIAKHGNGQNKRFDSIKTKPDWFIVKHFAGPVQYASEGFLDKNKDQLPSPIVDVMKASSNAFIANLFIQNELKKSADAPPSPAPTSGPLKKRKAYTVSNDFKEQLQSLMDTVNKTEPHFIRCVKPNPQNVCDIYDRMSVTEQLRYGGVLQAVQVSRAGYPIRITHMDVWLDYRYLLPSKNERLQLEKNNDSRARATELMKVLEVSLKIPRQPVTNSITWAVGKTMVFLKQISYETLQRGRSKKRNQCAIKIQAVWKGYSQRMWYARARESIIRIQALFRGKLARMEAARRRIEIAAVVVQSVLRMTHARNQYLLLMRHATKIQCHWRGRVARQLAATLRIDRAACTIQSSWKRFVVRRAYLEILAGVEQAQRNLRMRESREQLKRLKQESKEVGSLLSKFETNQAEMQGVKRRNDELESSKVHLANERVSAQKKVETLEGELKVFKQENDTLKNLRAEVAALRARVAELESAGIQPGAPLAGGFTAAVAASISRRSSVAEAPQISMAQAMAMLSLPVASGPADIPPIPTVSTSAEATPAAGSVARSPEVTSSAVTQALDQFKNWLGVQRSGTMKPSGPAPGLTLSVLGSSLKGTKAMKTASKDADAISELRPVQELQDGESAITCIAFGQEKIHRAYVLLAAASKDGTVVIYRCYRTEMERLSLNEAEFPKEDPSSANITGSDYGNIVVHCRLTGHTRAITSLFFSLLEDMVVTTSIDKSVRFWNADTGEMLKVFTDSSPVPVACFLPFNPSVFVAANSNAVLRLVNATNGMVLQKLKVEAEVRALKFDDTGLFLMAGTKNGSIHVLEACDNATLRFKFKMQLARGGITSITFVGAANGQPPCLLVNSSDSSISIVDCIYGNPGNSLINLNVRHRVKIAHSLLPLKSCFSPSDQGFLVSGSEDKGVYVFSLAKGANYKMHVLHHHQVPVVATACNQQDTLLASADSLGRIVLWRRLDFSHLGQLQPAASFSYP